MRHLLAIAASLVAVGSAGCRGYLDPQPSVTPDTDDSAAPIEDTAPDQETGSNDTDETDTDDTASTPDPIRWSAMAVGAVFTCGLKLDGTIRCWGHEKVQGKEPPGAFASVHAGYLHACALDAHGEATCWGSEAYGKSDVPSGPWVRLALGLDHGCGLRADGGVTCWGDDSDGQLQAPPGEFVQITANSNYTCARRADGTVSCWGENDGFAAPTDLDVEDVRCGFIAACGIDSAGAANCWGNIEAMDLYDLHPNPVEGPWKLVQVGTYHGCGLRQDATIDCWGQPERYDPLTPDIWNFDPPSGAFIDLQVYEHSCALSTDGTMTCWGYDPRGATRVPTE